jgi:hypothetical protein
MSRLPALRCADVLARRSVFFAFQLAHLRHELFAQSGVRCQALVVARDVLAQVLLFHFQQSFGVLALQARNEQPEKTTNKVRQSLEHEYTPVILGLKFARNRAA